MKYRPLLASGLALLAIASLPLVPRPALATDDEQGRKACMTDALTVCARFIPDRQRIATCLMNNRQNISEPCRILISAGTDVR